MPFRVASAIIVVTATTTNGSTADTCSTTATNTNNDNRNFMDIDNDVINIDLADIRRSLDKYVECFCKKKNTHF